MEWRGDEQKEHVGAGDVGGPEEVLGERGVCDDQSVQEEPRETREGV